MKMDDLNGVFRRTEKGRKCKALFSYAPAHEDELKLAVGDEIVMLGEVEEGWWRGRLGGKIGVFPSNFVTLMEEMEEKESVPALPPKPLREMARVLFSYQPTQPDELELKEGEIITVLNKNCEDKGWWKGEVNGKIGVFPDNFVEVITPVSNSGPASLPSQTSESKPPLTASLSASSSDSKLVKTPILNMSTSSDSNLLREKVGVSLSDEQKLLQAEDSFNIAPTETLTHLTANRARPVSQRRPPSTYASKAGHSLEPIEIEKEVVAEIDGPQSLEIKPNKALPKQQPWMEELKMNQVKKEPSQEPPFGRPLKPVFKKVTGGFPSQHEAEQKAPPSNGETARPPVTSRPSNIPNTVIPNARASVNLSKPAVPPPPSLKSPLDQPKPPAVYDRIQQPVNNDEPSVDDEIIHLRQRVTTLESTVSMLQQELLQLKKRLDHGNGQPIVHI